MGIYEDLKAAIADVITTNGKNEITGAILNDVLQNIVSSIGEHATFAGIATPDVQPGTVDQNVFYLATIAGTYIYFDEIVVNSGEVAILTNKTGSWKKKFSGLATQEKLTELEKKVSNIIIDSEMSDTSENAVSNKVIKAYVDRVKAYIDDILGKNVTDAIDNINEILAFLSTISDKDTLAGIFEELKQYIDNADNLVKQYIDNVVRTLAAVAKSGSYNDLIDKPIIPAAVTESTISEWGFTKNTGTIKGIIMNGVLQKESDGNVNLGTVITDISGKQDKLISGTNIKTLNGIPLLGSGNIQIGGSISRVEMTSEIASIKANEFYVWQMVNSLNITLISGSEKVMNRYIFQFRNPKETTALLTLPDDITWSTDTELDDNGLPIMETLAFCRIEIIEGLATLKKWKLVYIQFADKEVERVLISKDIGDGIGITKKDAAAVTDMDYVFGLNESITEFDEFQYFTGVTRLLSDNTSINHGIGFMECTSLIRITLPTSLVRFANGSDTSYGGAGAFYGCTNLEYVGNTSQVDYVGNASFYACESLLAIDLSSAIYIGSNAFQNCKALKQVVLSNNLQEIGSYAFLGCESLELDITGKLTLIKKLPLGVFSGTKTTGELSMPNLEIITYGYVKRQAFESANLIKILNLGKISEIPDGYNNNYPGVFAKNGNLILVILPETLTYIGNRAFYQDTSLQTIICNAVTPPQLHNTAFNSTNSTFIIYVPDASVEAYKAATNWNTYADRIKGISEYTG